MDGGSFQLVFPVSPAGAYRVLRHRLQLVNTSKVKLRPTRYVPTGLLLGLTELDVSLQFKWKTPPSRGGDKM